MIRKARAEGAGTGRDGPPEIFRPIRACSPVALFLQDPLQGEKGTNPED